MPSVTRLDMLMKHNQPCQGVFARKNQRMPGVFSKDEKEYLEHLSILFQRLNNFGLTINLKKCRFGKNEIRFLGPCHNIKRNFPWNCQD